MAQDLVLPSRIKMSKMKYHYQVNGKNEWNSFKPTIVILISYFVAWPLIFHYGYPKRGLADMADGIVYMLTGAFLFFLSAYIIHLRYYFINKDIELIFDDEKKEIKILNRKLQISKQFRIDEIKAIVYTMTPPKAEKRTKWFPWDNYSYMEIFLKNGERFIITSLMTERLHIGIEDKEIVVTSFYPYASGLDDIH